VWNAFEAAPEPCFECGGDTCTALSEYCDISAPDEPACRALPTACSGNGSCQCLVDAGLDVVSCNEDGGGVTAELSGASACPTVVRSRSVYFPVETGCDPPCQGAESCHEVYQHQGPIPVQDVFECVDPSTITGPSETRDDTLSCAPDEVCLTYGEEVFTDDSGEPRVDTYQIGRCARVAECPETPAGCECLEQTCDEVFSDQGFPGECLESPSGLECVEISG
jgi:hypothetical protein